MDLGTTKMIARTDGGIGWMIFNQPEKHNAMSYEMWLAMPRVIAAFEADPEVRVIVLTGAGERAFVSGADISEFESKRSAEENIRIYDAAGEAAQSALIDATKPTIAMIRGICIGGGLAIALNTDIRICSDNSVFAVPAARLGLGYKYDGIKRLVDVVGPQFAKEIFFSAGKFTAEDARIMGLVNRVVPLGELPRRGPVLLLRLREAVAVVMRVRNADCRANVTLTDAVRFARCTCSRRACFTHARIGMQLAINPMIFSHADCLSHADVPLCWQYRRYRT